MNSDISKRTSDFSLPNMNWASVRATSVLPTPVASKKKNEPMGSFGFFTPAPLRRFFFNRGDGNTSPARYHILDVLPTDKAGGGFIEVVFFAKGPQVLALFAFFVRVEARLFELVVRDGVFHAVYDELDPLLDLRDLLRQ